MARIPKRYSALWMPNASRWASDQMPVLTRLILLGVLVLGAATVVACATETAAYTIEAKDDLTFTLDSITVKPGQTVELTLVNNGRLDHTFTAPDLNIEFPMPAGTTSKETFIVSTPGEYRFFCAVIGHFDTMKGKVVAK